VCSHTLPIGRSRAASLPFRALGVHSSVVIARL